MACDLCDDRRASTACATARSGRASRWGAALNGRAYTGMTCDLCDNRRASTACATARLGRASRSSPVNPSRARPATGWPCRATPRSSSCARRRALCCSIPPCRSTPVPAPLLLLHASMCHSAAQHRAHHPAREGAPAPTKNPSRKRTPVHRFPGSAVCACMQLSPVPALLVQLHACAPEGWALCGGAVDPGPSCLFLPRSIPLLPVPLSLAIM
jgi:hypothetical protein